MFFLNFVDVNKAEGEEGPKEEEELRATLTLLLLLSLSIYLHDSHIQVMAELIKYDKC